MRQIATQLAGSSVGRQLVMTSKAYARRAGAETADVVQAYESNSDGEET